MLQYASMTKPMVAEAFEIWAGEIRGQGQK